MIVRNVAIAFCAALAFVPLSTAAPVRAASNPVTISQCFITVPKAMSKLASGTQIDYMVNGRKAASKITFAVGYRNSDNKFLRKVTDVGTFNPGSQIQHHFDLYNDVTYGGKTVQSCQAVKILWADGSSWSM